MKRARIGLVLFAFFPLFNSSAAEVSDVPFNKCDWPTVWSMLSVASARRQADIASPIKPLNKKIRDLLDKVKEANAPIDKNLNKQDLVEINQLMQRVNSINAVLNLESHRDRDMDVFDHLIHVADKNYRWYAPEPESSPEYFYQTMISMFPALTPQNANDQITIPPYPTCSTQIALFRIESEATAKLNKLSESENAEHLLEVIQDMTKRYHVVRLDSANLSQKDQKTFDEINTRFIIPANHEQQFINNIEAIRILDEASRMINETGRQDLADSGGDGTKVGTSLDRKIQNHELSERMTRAIGMMKLIGNKIPPRFEMLDFPTKPFKKDAK